MRVTHLQIAKLAGVSRSLVSMALKGSGRVDKNTREKIEKIANDLGYRPNMLIKGIQTGRTMTVGVVIRAQRAFFGQMLSGVQDTLEEHDYLPIIIWLSSRMSVIEQIMRLIDQRVDGIIIKPEEQLCAESLKKVLKYNIPIVTVDSYVKGGANVDFSGSHDAMIGQIAAEHFLKLGHKKTAVVSVKNKLHLASRVDAFRRAIESAPGAKCELFEIEEFESEWGCKALIEEIKPTAVFFTADTLAGHFINLAREYKISIPEDISVIGAANMELGEYTSPSLTTIEQHPYNIGSNAARLLIKRLEDDGKLKSSQHVLEMPELIIRKSTAPPAE